MGQILDYDKYRFMPVKDQGKGNELGVFEVGTTGKMCHNLGNMMSLGSWGLIRKPIKRVRLVGVDRETLCNLKGECVHQDGLRFPELMDYLKKHGFQTMEVKESGQYQWTELVITLVSLDLARDDSVAANIN